MIRAIAVTVLVAAAAGFLSHNAVGYRRAGRSYVESEKEKRRTMGLKPSARFSRPWGVKGADYKKCR